MSKFAWLFGGQRKNDPKLEPEKKIASDEGKRIQRRKAFCDNCKKTVDAMVNNQGHFMTPVVVGDPTSEHIDFIGSCPSCDTDICGDCATWVREEPLSASLMLRKPACKRCGTILVGKTQVDFRRLQELHKELQKTQTTDKITVARRLIRILNEEAPVLIEQMSRQKYDALLKIMMDLQAELKDPTDDRTMNR